MKIHHYCYAGDSYDAFLSKELPEWHYIEGMHGFNMSMVSIDGDRELFCIRYSILPEAIHTREVIPGYLCDPEAAAKVTKGKQDEYDKSKIGKAFVWDNWFQNIDSYILFVGSFKGSKISIDRTVRPLRYKRPMMPSFMVPRHPFGTAEDLRLFRSGEKILFHDSKTTFIMEVAVRGDSIVTTDHDASLYSNVFLCPKLPHETDKSFHYERFEKNWSLFDITDTAFHFLHWFVGNTVMGVNVNKNANRCKKISILEMKGDVLEGLPSKDSKSPMFSFGTPFVEVDAAWTEKWRSARPEVEEVLLDRICVGHTKIPSDKINEAEYNKNFSKVLTTVSKEFKNYKDKYRPHRRLIYMMYFIRLIKYKRKDGRHDYDMSISDSYLPHNKAAVHRDKYKFSLVFPMSVVKKKLGKKELLCVSCGEGDFYTVVLTFSERDVVDACRHDVRHMRLKDYKYEIVSFP
nr:hypothetical protein TetV2_00207 [Oceanusvirus sp.]